MALDEFKLVCMPVLLRQGVDIEKAIKGSVGIISCHIPLIGVTLWLAVISCLAQSSVQTGEYPFVTLHDIDNVLVYVKGLYFRGCDTEPYQILLPVPFHLWTPPHWLACACMGLPFFHHRFTQNLDMSSYHVCLVVLGTSGHPLRFAILSAPKYSPSTSCPRCAHT